MKKILFYTDTPQIGGAELQMFLLAKFLDKEKFTPIIALSNYPQLDKLAENFEKENIKVIRLNVKHKHDPRHYTQLIKILKIEKIDLLHLHVWNPASCRYAFFAASNTKTPTIITEHDPFKLPILKNFFKKIALKKANKIIAISHNNQRILKKLYPKQAYKISVIHNGIDLTWWQSQLIRFTDDDKRQIKTEKFHAKENTLIITTIAELHERKGIQYLIKAIPPLTAKFPNIKLIIIGEGKERSNLEKLIKKLKMERNIQLLGRQGEIPKLLKSSDIFALPSRREGFGLVNLEAMMIPLPIVATKVGGIPEIVIDQETGIIVGPENENALTKALKTLIEKPKLREKYAQAGLMRLQENFTAQKMANQYEKKYKQILP